MAVRRLPPMEVTFSKPVKLARAVLPPPYEPMFKLPFIVLKPSSPVKLVKTGSPSILRSPPSEVRFSNPAILVRDGFPPPKCYNKPWILWLRTKKLGGKQADCAHSLRGGGVPVG